MSLPCDQDLGTQSFFCTIKGSIVLDVTNMPVEWQERLPRKYFLALLRASRLRMRSPQGTWAEVANDFKVRVEEQSERPCFKL